MCDNRNKKNSVRNKTALRLFDFEDNNGPGLLYQFQLPNNIPRANLRFNSSKGGLRSGSSNSNNSFTSRVTGESVKLPNKRIKVRPPIPVPEVEVESPSSDTGTAGSDTSSYDYDYASISENDSGLQSACGGGGVGGGGGGPSSDSNNVMNMTSNTTSNNIGGLNTNVLPLNCELLRRRIIEERKNRIRARTVSGTSELLDEDGYSYVSYPGDDENNKEEEGENNEVNKGHKFKKFLGSGAIYEGPFGPRNYACFDQNGGGAKSIKVVEECIVNHILPSPPVLLQKLRAQAEEQIKSFCAQEDYYDDLCIIPYDSWNHAVQSLLFASEHHGSIIILTDGSWHNSSWGRIAKKVITIREKDDFTLDLKHLEKVLRSLTRSRMSFLFSSQIPIFGVFSGVSRITGILRDDVAITSVLKKYGAYSIWDMSLASPHVKFYMMNDGKCETRKDAVFIQGDKFLGGLQSSGALIIRKDASYSKKLLMEVSKSTSIGVVRLGLVLNLHSIIGTEKIILTEQNYVRQALRSWMNIPNLLVLGGNGRDNSFFVPRLNVISIMIRHKESGLLLHQGFIAQALLDLFGIQSEIMDISWEDPTLDLIFEEMNPSMRKRFRSSSWKPGFVQLSFSHYLQEDEVKMVIEGVKFMGRKGWKLLPLYELNEKGHHGGSWKAVKGIVRKQEKALAGLESLLLGNQSQNAPSSKLRRLRSSRSSPEDYLRTAEGLLPSQKELYIDSTIDQRKLPVFVSGQNPDRFWFLQPSEAKFYLEGGKKPVSKWQYFYFIPKRAKPKPVANPRRANKAKMMMKGRRNKLSIMEYSPGSIPQELIDLIYRANDDNDNNNGDKAKLQLFMTNSLLSLDVRFNDYDKTDDLLKFSRKKLAIDLNNGEDGDEDDFD